VYTGGYKISIVLYNKNIGLKKVEKIGRSDPNPKNFP
jgi:hypothetical protein